MTEFDSQLRQLEQVPFYVASSYYDGNIWDLRQHPLFFQLTEKQKAMIQRRKSSHYIQFPNEGNWHINSQLKMFCVELLETHMFQLTTFAVAAYSIALISDYVSTSFPGVISVSDISLTELEAGFENFLKEKGRVTAIEYGNTANEKMEKTKYHMRSIPIRFLRKFHDYYYQRETKKIFDDELAKDKWDCRNLRFTINGFNPSRPRYIISFLNIAQERIKAVAKQFIEIRLRGGIKFATCQDYLKGINLLSEFLSEKHPDIESLPELNRTIIEEFLGFVELMNLADRTKTSRIGSVKTFFEICELIAIEDRPSGTLIIESDLRRKNKHLPRPVPKYILNQVFAKIDLLKIETARMFFVLHAIGMRIGELCNLPIDSLKQLPSGSEYIEYLQDKTEVIQSRVLEPEIASIIHASIEDSKTRFGAGAKYIFSQTKHKPISEDKFSRDLNNFSFAVGIKDNNGKLYRFKSHQFRHSVVMRYIDMGLDIKILQLLMGWKSTGPYNYYAQMSDPVFKK